MHSGIWTAAAVAIVCLAGAPAEASGQKTFSGVAAYYDTHYAGRTATGERYDPSKFTAAHRTLPFGTRLRVTDRQTHRSVVVIVNDRGPFNKGRVLDLSLAAAKALHMHGARHHPRDGGGAIARAATTPATRSSELTDGEQRIQVSGLAAKASPNRRCTVFSSSSVMKTVLPAPGSGAGTAYEKECRL